MIKNKIVKATNTKLHSQESQLPSLKELGASFSSIVSPSNLKQLEMGTPYLKHLVWFLTVIIITGFTSSSYAQKKEQDLYMIARPMQDSIVLRWAPSDYSTWRLGNKYGYNLVRYTIIRDSVLLEIPEKLVLSSKALKPLELNQWESLVKNNKYGGLAAQAIYGEEFNIEANEGLNPENVVSKAKEQKQRFSLALYGADMSPEVAKASALWYTDNKAKSNEKYLYRVFISPPDSLTVNVDTAFVFTGISEYLPLPKPIEVSLKFVDNIVQVGWNIFAQNKIYNSWQVERSANNGRTYTLITNEPLVPIAPNNKPVEFAYKMDSLPQYNKEYLYRVRGINSFGENGPWSEPVKGKAIETVKGAPIIKNYTESKGQVILAWDFSLEEERKINHFKILRANSSLENFVNINDKVKSNERTFTDKSPISSAYYKVVSVDEYSNEKESPIFLVQISDSIPPVSPVGLIGYADSLGKIHISWEPNTEADIHGYMVFKSASGKDEYSQITKRPVTKANFTDSIQKNDLNAGVYYRIIAIDHNYNQSDFSGVLHVNKVDLSGPSVPVITYCKATDKGIILKWINSTSSDVDKHIVLRHQDGDSTWTKVTEIKFENGIIESTFTDDKASQNKIGRYKVVALDKSGNQSIPALSVDVRALSLGKVQKLKKIKKNINYEEGKILLSWEVPEQAVKNYKVYRKTRNINYTVYETIVGDKNTFEDYGMKAGNFYAYRIKIIYADGSVSGFSDEIRIDF